MYTKPTVTGVGAVVVFQPHPLSHSVIASVCLGGWGGVIQTRDFFLLQVAKQVSQVSARCETVPGMYHNRSATRQPWGRRLSCLVRATKTCVTVSALLKKCKTLIKISAVIKMYFMCTHEHT